MPATAMAVLPTRATAPRGDGAGADDVVDAEFKEV